MSEEIFSSKPDLVFDGGTMDCGSGLILLIRENMLKVPEGGLLEILSREPTVKTELPPWCRMVGHVHVSSELVAEGQWRHRVQRGSNQDAEQKELESDKQQAQAYKWNLRSRQTNTNELTIYSRNFSWKSGLSIDFDKSGTFPSSLEQCLGALLADVLICFGNQCSRRGLTVDEIEGTINANLNNVLAASGLDEGDSSIKRIGLNAYVTSPAQESGLRDAWNAGLRQSPVYQTMMKACEVELRLVFL